MRIPTLEELCCRGQKHSVHGELQQNVSAVGMFCLRMQQHVGLNVDPSHVACVSLGEVCYLIYWMTIMMTIIKLLLYVLKQILLMWQTPCLAQSKCSKKLILGIKKMMMRMILVIITYTALKGALSWGMLGSWGQMLL